MSAPNDHIGDAHTIIKQDFPISSVIYARFVVVFQYTLSQLPIALSCYSNYPTVCYKYLWKKCLAVSQVSYS
jgi:hypothetical protein